MYFPNNAPVARPRVSQVDTDRMSERLTAGLREIQERDLARDLLIVEATVTLESLTRMFEQA